MVGDDEKKALLSISNNKDMLNVYSKLLDSLSVFPAFIICENLEDNSDYLCHRLLNGNNLFYIENTTDDKIIGIMSDKLNVQKCNIYPALPFENYSFSNEEISKWLRCACCLAKIFDVECPQIVFDHDGGSMASGEAGIIFIEDSLNNFDTFVCMTHEFRHIWQHKNHPEWFENYIQPQDDIRGYLFNKTEIDAEAFARRFAGIILDIPIENDFELYYDEDPELESAYYNTALNTSLVEFLNKKKEVKTIKGLLKE